MRWRVTLFEFELNVVRHVGTRAQAADMWSRLRLNHEDKTLIEEDIPVLRITPSNPQKREPGIIYMQVEDAKSDKGGVRQPGVYAKSTAPGAYDKNSQ